MLTGQVEEMYGGHTIVKAFNGEEEAIKEFEKANIVVKTIRIGKNDRIKESMSFPTFRFKELIEEEWEDSTFGNYLRETRFLFVVYKFDDNDILRLRGCQFWNIPYEPGTRHICISSGNGTWYGSLCNRKYTLLYSSPYGI